MSQDVVFSSPSAPSAVSDALQNASRLPATVAAPDASVDAILATARAEYRSLLGVLYDAGYFGGAISIKADGVEVATMSPFARPARIAQVVVEVVPGPQFSFGEVRLAPLPDGTPVPDGFQTGAPAGSGIIQNAARTAVTAWREDGYAKATLGDRRLLADHRTAELDADLTMIPGPRLRFAPLQVSGGSGVRAERVIAIAGLKPDTVFSQSAVETAARRLRETGAFSSVAMAEAEVPNPDGSLDITAQLVDAPLRRIGFGAEIGSSEGLSVNGFFLHRNLLGGAERLRFDASISDIGRDGKGVDYALGVSLQRPGTFGPDNLLTLSAQVAREDDTNRLSDLFELGAVLSRQVAQDLTVSAGLTFAAEKLDRRPGKSEMRVLALPISLGYDNRDDPLSATEGSFVSAELRPFLGFNDARNGLRTTLDARGYLAVNEARSTILAARFQLGSLVGADRNEVPSNYLFLSGGSGTVRGQRFESLGTTLGGQKIGGRSFIGLSVEARHSFTDTWGAVAFYDVGYIGAESFPDATSGTWHDGIGIGLRYQTAIGPIRVDAAIPASGGTFSDLQLYIGIGQTF